MISKQLNVHGGKTEMAYTSLNQLDFSIKTDVFPSPSDWRDVVIYFLMVDRFDNNDPAIPLYQKDLAASGRDPEQGHIFQGGTINGVTRRLDYLEKLGIGGIWLSPVFKNRQEKKDSYHGYGIQNFLDVDPRFGTVEDLKTLVRKAHEHGIYVILDIILNHTGDNWGYPGDHPYYYYDLEPSPFPFGFWREKDNTPGLQIEDGVWPVQFQDPEFYKRRGQIRNWGNNQEAVNGDFLSLKELNLTKPEVLSNLIAVYKYWIAVTDVDGFRIDTVKHMEDSATALFCNAIREYARKIGKHNFFIFGEVVGDDSLLQRYIGRNSRIDGTNERFPSLDACLDFPLYFILEEVIKGFTNPSVLRERYERFRTAYADHGSAGEFFVTFFDNHDQMVRPYRRFLHHNPHTAQIILAAGYLLTSQGVPCLYYGTEQNFDGGGPSDSYVRECMFGGNWGAFNSTGHHFFNEKGDTFKKIAAINKIRKKLPPLRYGRQYFREISGNDCDFSYPLDGRCTLAYSRILDDTEVIVLLNLDTERRCDRVTIDFSLNRAGERFVDQLALDRHATVEVYADRKTVAMELEGHTMAILVKS